MKSRKIFKVFICTVFVMTCISNLAIGSQGDLKDCQFQPVAREKVPDILEQISAQTKENYERIKSWQGEVEFTSESINTGDDAEKIFRNRTTSQGKTPQFILQRACGTRKFIIDIKNESNYEYLFRPEPMQYIDVNSGTFLDTLPGFSFPVQDAFIVTPQEYLECTSVGYKDTISKIVTSRQATKKPLNKSMRKNASDQRATVLKEGIFDPRNLIYINSESGHWDYLALCQRRFKKKDKEPNLPPLKFEESHDGNDVVYHMLIPFRISKKQHIFMSKYFASKAGYNLVKSQTLGPELQKQFGGEIEYSVIDGIYVPRHIVSYTYDIRDGSVVQTKKYVFKNQQLNQPIPEETFTYKNLGLKENDKVIDKTENKEYRYKEATKSLELIEKK
ncbi:MAG: hypothetical protein PHQ00_00435 [Phycisphaerae bacterium]|nr:hypothetical protein [Phycisphaerae bacterium]